MALRIVSHPKRYHARSNPNAWSPFVVELLLMMRGVFLLIVMRQVFINVLGLKSLVFFNTTMVMLQSCFRPVRCKVKLTLACVFIYEAFVIFYSGFYEPGSVYFTLPHPFSLVTLSI